MALQINDRVAVLRADVWMPGTVVGFGDNAEIDIDLDYPDPSGCCSIWCYGGSVNLRKIHTNHWAKPTPDRQFDWEAHFDNDEPNDDGQMMVGYGHTEDEAIVDLMELAS